MADDAGIDALADKLTRRTRNVPPPRHAPPPRSPALPAAPAAAPTAAPPGPPAAAEPDPQAQVPTPAAPSPDVSTATPTLGPAPTAESGTRAVGPPPDSVPSHREADTPDAPDPRATSRAGRPRSQASPAPARERVPLAGGETHLTLRVPKALDDELVDRIYSLRRERGLRSTKTELVKMFLWGLRDESDEELERKVRAYRRAVEDSTTAD